MFYELCKAIVSLLCLVLYIIITVAIHKARKREERDEITVYPSKYYKRLAFDLVSDGCMLAFVLSVVANFIYLKNGGFEIDYWCTLYAATIKYLGYRDNY